MNINVEQTVHELNIACSESDDGIVFKLDKGRRDPTGRTVFVLRHGTAPRNQTDPSTWDDRYMLGLRPLREDYLAGRTKGTFLVVLEVHQTTTRYRRGGRTDTTTIDWIQPDFRIVYGTYEKLSSQIDELQQTPGTKAIAQIDALWAKRDALLMAAAKVVIRRLVRREQAKKAVKRAAQAAREEHYRDQQGLGDITAAAMAPTSAALVHETDNAIAVLAELAAA